MYCPHCGVQNSQETRFCRGCGEDLKLVSQAVTKSLPLVIANRVDEAIERGRGGWRSYQLFRAEHRKPLGQALMSVFSLFIVVWILMLGHGNVSFASGFLLVMSLSLLFTSVHELWTRKRRESQTRKPGELTSSFSTKELRPAHEVPTTSVTESTTRKLKVEPRRETRANDLN
jgi:zinc-ribbon domain